MTDAIPHPHPPRDLVLSAAQVIVVIACIAVIFAMVLIGFGTAAVATVQHAEIAAKLAAAGAPSFVAWLLVGALLLVEALLYLALRFLLELRGIGNSVKTGDPFHPANAVRLERMGWIAVIIQVMVMPLGALANWLKPFAESLGDNVEIGINGGLDGGGILLILILFILARVFRRGTAMREELEGTV